MAPGNPPLIRKECITEINAADKGAKLMTLCTREATWVYTGLELHPRDKWVLPGLRSAAVGNQGNSYLAYFGSVGKQLQL